jgi:hypothetical protein
LTVKTLFSFSNKKPLTKKEFSESKKCKVQNNPPTNGRLNRMAD